LALRSCFLLNQQQRGGGGSGTWQVRYQTGLPGSLFVLWRTLRTPAAILGKKLAGKFDGLSD
jgi:hypothetical protein